jgi:23S rRNA (cytidine1920-2'-O)/16S rRNA (cytidine1409-2'-O)-methyltransferase
MVAAVYQDLALPRKDFRVTQLGTMRLDERLVSDGLCDSRQRAQALIMAGAVLVSGQVVSKAGQKVGPEAEVQLKGNPLPFVSRGGLKLQHALDYFSVAVPGRRALDIGASTGGFTDCLLQAGAAQVTAVDVGYGQLAYKLQQDPRVTVLDRKNARFLLPADLPYVPDLATCDASFISQTLLLPTMVSLLAPGSPLLTLVKPQFEVEKGQVGKGGVVRDPALHEQAVARCLAMAERLGCTVVGVTPSPIRGPAGNVEFVLYVVTSAHPADENKTQSNKMNEAALPISLDNRSHDA